MLANSPQNVPLDPLRRRAILALVMVNLLWGISFPAMKATNLLVEAQQAGNAQPSPADKTMLVESAVPRDTLAVATTQVTAACFLITVRFSIALVLLGLFFPRLFRGLTAEHWRMGAWTGLAFAAGFVLQIVGLNYVPASRSGFLTSLTVIFTPIAAVVIERRFPRVSVLFGAAAALVGTGILTGLFELTGPFGLRLASGALGRIGPGDWLTATAAGVFTLQILLIDRYSRRMSAGQLTPGMFVATLGIGVCLFVSGHAMQPPARGAAAWSGLLADLPFLVLVFVMSVFCTVLAFYWMNKYQAHVSPAQAALIYTLEPVFAALWAMILPDMITSLTNAYVHSSGAAAATFRLNYVSERPGWELLIGGSLVVLGNLLALLPSRRKA
jgi:drug/metabolite transporter (DMT)-like permease